MKPETPPAAAEVSKPRAAESTPPDLGEARDEAVRRIAYFLYMERGCFDGYETEDWLRAEALVSQEAAATVPPAKPARTTTAEAAPAPAAAKPAAAKPTAAKPAAAKPAVAKPAAAKPAAAKPAAAKRTAAKPSGA